MSENRTCKGPCGESLPATEEHFFFRVAKKNGKSYPSSYCRPCEKAKSAKARRDRYATPEGKRTIDSQTAAYRAKPEKRKLISEHLKTRYRNDEEYRTRVLVNARRWQRENPHRNARNKSAWHQRTKRRTYRKTSIFETFFPDLKLRGVVRRAVCEAMKASGGAKAGRSILKHLPYSMHELRAHLEALWEPWMSWVNYGPWAADRRTWQIDHIVSQARLPYSDYSDPNFTACWALRNLRPLEAVRNLSEGCRSGSGTLSHVPT